MMRSLGIAVIGVSFLVGNFLTLCDLCAFSVDSVVPFLGTTHHSDDQLILFETTEDTKEARSTQKKATTPFEISHKESENLRMADQPLPTPSSRTLQVLFYNVENLFHPSDDSSRTSDDPYTPEGEHEWHRYRYQRKLSELFKTIAAIGKGKTPAIMGFAEIEERRVLEDLIRYTPFDDEKLCVLQYPSPDHRGMDVGMIFRKDRFQPLYLERIQVDLEAGGGSPTREMLYVKGEAGKEILHLFVAHWPSRWGGRARTEWKRMKAARRLKEELDSIEASDPNAAILIMGDLNDTPRNRSVRDVLKAGDCSEEKSHPWCDLMAGQEKGSYFHQGNWSYLDHFIAPSRMLISDGKSPLKISDAEAHELPWLMKERRGEGHEEKVPYRTFSGPAYIGGISDHLPISVRLREGVN